MILILTRTREEMFETFHKPHEEAANILSKWEYQELEYLKAEYKRLLDAVFSAYMQDRLDKVEYAIELKKGNEEEIWDSLS
jgi:hypothetical protein